MVTRVLWSLSLGILLLGCNVKKEEKGALPELDIDVTADAGELPEYAVDWADVNVGTTTKMVKIPKVVIVMEEEEVEVPFIDVDMPDGGVKEERTIMVEAEVDGKEHALNIKEIWANDNNLFVISELTALEENIGEKKMRIADQVTLNAPDLNVKHYIVGARPNRVFNTQHVYVDNLEDLRSKLDDYTVIYEE